MAHLDKRSTQFKHIDGADLSIAHEFKQHLLQKINPLEILLFGSRARGDAEADSDMDLFVLVDHESSDIEHFVSDCAWEAGFSRDMVIVPVVVGKDRLDGHLQESFFIHNVYGEGISI